MTIQRVTVTATRTYVLDTADFVDEDDEEAEEPSVDDAVVMLRESLEDGSNDLSEFFESASIEVVKA
jgi:hypothetical protein